MTAAHTNTDSLLVKALLQHLERSDGKLRLGKEQSALIKIISQVKTSTRIQRELEEAIGFAHFLATHKQEPAAADQIMQLLTRSFVARKK
jgi:hypothetical protein